MLVPDVQRVWKLYEAADSRYKHEHTLLSQGNSHTHINCIFLLIFFPVVNAFNAHTKSAKVLK